MKKILAIVLTLSMVFSVPVFADTTTPAQPAATETTTTTPAAPEAQPASDITTTTQTDASQTPQGAETTTTTAPAPADTTTTTTVPVDATTTVDAGITPDSLFYSLDKLMEKIQLALVTDAVKQAELLSKIAQERLAESTEMANKADVELTQKALDEYKANLEQAVTLINTAMEQGKQVADVMENINQENLKDAAAVEKILASIPEQYKEQVKTEIAKIAAAADAAADTAATVENKDEEQNSVKQEITLKLIEEKVQDPALIAKIKASGLNTRQIIAVISLSEQSKKPLGEVLDMFVANEKGIGATAHQLGLSTKDALKGINEAFKDAKETIKEAFKAAMKSVDEEDKDDVEGIINNSLTGTDAAQAAQINAANEELQKVIADAKAQVAAISAASKGKKAEKAIEKLEKKIDKSKEQAEKALEKNKEKLEKAKKHSEKIEKDKHDKDNDNDRDDDEHDDDQDED